MTKYRVKAYFMHEKEEAAARAAADRDIIRSCEWTPGYVMGVVDKADIGGLQEQGLVVTPIEKIVGAPATARAPSAKPSGRRGAGPAAAPRPPGPAIAAIQPLNAPLVALGKRGRPLSTTVPDKQPSEKILSRDRRSAEFYVIRLHGPLTEDRRATLAKKKITLLER